MGANIATDVAQEQFCEATIGMHAHKYGDIGYWWQRDSTVE